MILAVATGARSVEWMGRDGDFLGVGTNHSAVQLWDASKLRQVRGLFLSETDFVFGILCECTTQYM